MDTYPSTWHNREIYSSHGTWSTARGGYGETKYGSYQRPDNWIQAVTRLNVSYWIHRAYMAFDTGELPADKVVKAAQLGLFVTEVGITNALVYITKGLWDEPVVPEDYALQTDETTDLGHKVTGDMVVGQYNWIDLNEAGIAWINQRPVEIKQHESYDWQMNLHDGIFSPYQKGQTFTPQNTHTATKLRLRLKRAGSPGTLYINIYVADAGHLPTGPVLASGTIDGNTLTTATWGEWYLIDLGAGFTATSGTEYCIVGHILDGSISKCVFWEGAGNSQYPNGYRLRSGDDGSSWEASTTHDLYFIEYETATVGGTKFCLRMYGDLVDSAPPTFAEQRVRFYSSQKGNGYSPLLALEFPAGRSQAYIT